MPYESIPREKVLAIIERRGPSQTLDVKRELGGADSVLVGAVLSEMAATGSIAISRTKRGESPFYYLPSRPESLEAIQQYLNEKDQRTVRLLKYSGVLKESEQDPLTRVSLGNIHDFSRSFAVGEERYWRYYLLSEEEAREKVAPKTETPAETSKDEPAEEPENPKPVDEPAKPPKQQELPKDEPAGSLAERLRAFAKGARISEMKEVKQDQEIRCRLVRDGPYGQETFLVHAFSRKTLPEQLVWTALLEARSEGLPLLILKDSAFPKTLQKKFADVPNVFFRRV